MNPESLLYAATHEWVQLTEVEGRKVATMGISAFAVEQLTDLVFLELPEVGRLVEAGEELCEVESVKAVSHVYAPVKGEVIMVNETLPDRLEVLNEDPYEAGWIARIRVSDEASLSELMDYAAYQKQCEEEGQG